MTTNDILSAILIGVFAFFWIDMWRMAFSHPRSGGTYASDEGPIERAIVRTIRGAMKR